MKTTLKNTVSDKMTRAFNPTLGIEPNNSLFEPMLKPKEKSGQ